MRFLYVLWLSFHCNARCRLGRMGVSSCICVSYIYLCRSRRSSHSNINASRPASGHRERTGSTESRRRAQILALTSAVSGGPDTEARDSRDSPGVESQRLKDQLVINEAQGKQIFELRSSEAMLKEEMEDLKAQVHDIMEKGKKAEATTLEYIQRYNEAMVEANQKISESKTQVDASEEIILSLRGRLYHCHCGASGQEREIQLDDLDSDY